MQRAPRALRWTPPFFKHGSPLIRIDQIHACLGRYSKLKKLERRLYAIDD